MNLRLADCLARADGYPSLEARVEQLRRVRGDRAAAAAEHFYKQRAQQMLEQTEALMDDFELEPAVINSLWVGINLAVWLAFSAVTGLVAWVLLT